MIVAYFNTLLSVIEQVNRKISKNTECLHNTKNQLDLIHHLQNNVLNNYKHFFSSAQVMFKKTDCRLFHKVSLDKFQNIKLEISKNNCFSLVGLLKENTTTGWFKQKFCSGGLGSPISRFQQHRSHPKTSISCKRPQSPCVLIRFFVHVYRESKLSRSLSIKTVIL